MDSKTYMPLYKLARELGLPAAWLKRQADAQQIPSLPVGRRRMFNANAVRETLQQMEQKQEVSRG